MEETSGRRGRGGRGDEIGRGGKYEDIEERKRSGTEKGKRKFKRLGKNNRRLIPSCKIGQKTTKKQQHRKENNNDERGDRRADGE